MIPPANIDFRPSTFIQPANDDFHDCAYRFGTPLTYLSDRQQVRLLILRGRLNATRETQLPKAA